MRTEQQANLSFRRNIGEKGAEALAPALPPTLKELYLGSNNVADGAAAFAHARLRVLVDV